MQACEDMGDARHKKSPHKGEPELNSQTFRDEAERVLRHNATLNAIAQRKRGTPGYLIATHADIAAQLGVQQRVVDRILGGARDGTELQLIAKSAYIKPIREMLGIRRIEIAVPVERAEILSRLAELPDAEFAPFRDAVQAKSK